MKINENQEKSLKIHETQKTVVGDSWFGFVKTAIQLRKKGLDSILLVKTAHKLFPKELLMKNILKEVNGKLMLAKLMELISRLVFTTSKTTIEIYLSFSLF